MSNISQATEEFAKDFKKEPNDEVVLWSGDNGVGFTVLRKYPDNIPFIPARNKDGEVDSVCMIKLGFPIRQETINEKEVALFISISKQSRYLLNGHWNYDFDDEEAPTKDSLEESKKSRQPVDLEDLTGHIYNKETKKIFNIEKERKEVSTNEIVEKLFKLHLKTVKLEGSWFRFKMFFKDVIVNPVEPIKKSLIWFLDFFLGKTIQSDSKADFGVGMFKPYKHSSLYTLADEQIDLFSTGVKIPKKSAVVVATLISLMTLLFLYLYSPEWWAELKTQSEIVQASFLLFLIFIIDYIIPHILLIAINLLIRFRIIMWEWKIKIK